MYGCWLRQFSDKPCDLGVFGRLQRAHLVPQRRLRWDGRRECAEDPRTWRWACMAHHHAFDRGFLYRRQPACEVLRLSEYPEDFKQWAAEQGYEYRGEDGWRLNRLLVG